METEISFLQTGSQTPSRSDITTEVVLTCFVIPFFISLKYANKIEQIFEFLYEANRANISSAILPIFL